jgi:hypothetical protein
MGRWPSPTALEHGEQPEHGGRLLDRDLVVAAVASVPAECGGAEPRRLFGEDQEGELEGFDKADMLELSCGRPCDEEIAVVERPAEASIGRAARGDANTCSYNSAGSLEARTMVIGCPAFRQTCFRHF